MIDCFHYSVLNFEYFPRGSGWQEPILSKATSSNSFGSWCRNRLIKLSQYDVDMFTAITSILTFHFDDTTNTKLSYEFILSSFFSLLSIFEYIHAS